MSKYESLQPRSVWQIFGEICKVPHGSGNETAIQNMFRGWAESRGLSVKSDDVGNLLVSIPASKGHEKAKLLLIQGHVDMVCEKNSDTKHDFEKDPIKVKVQGDWVSADGTTLGADNGIGVAMGLAIAEEKSLIHGPVEVLLTVDEERGLTGAAGVQKGFFTARKMINLDSEEDTGIFIGCAGGRDSDLTLLNNQDIRVWTSTTTAATPSRSSPAPCWPRRPRWTCASWRSTAAACATPSRARPKRKWSSTRTGAGCSRSWWKPPWRGSKKKNLPGVTTASR